MSQLEQSVTIDAAILHAIADDIREAYLSDERTWVVGFSGGKDSTALLQIIYYALRALPRSQLTKQVYVVASDTRVEAPQISTRIREELERIQTAADKDVLPFKTNLVFPKLNDTFWTNLIGRGYPSPTSHFRWCTDRLKIKPVSAFIQNVIDKSGEVVIVLGARRDESSTRAQAMKRSDLQGNRYRPHSELLRAWVYTPISELSSNDVWTYILQVPSPWAGDNRGLISLYKQASGGECPLVIDTSTPSCGNSRFGCWTCTVVERDKSMEALVESGEDHLEPLLEVRDFIKQVRDSPGARYDLRRNGTIPYRRGTDRSEVLTNTGPFTHTLRMEVLRRVLAAQKESGLSLIEGDELSLIQEIWSLEENDHPQKPRIPADGVKRIHQHVYEGGPMPTFGSDYEFLEHEDWLLKAACDTHEFPFELMRELRNVEEEHGHLKRRHGLPEQMRDLIRAESNRLFQSNSSGGSTD